MPVELQGGRRFESGWELIRVPIAQLVEHYLFHIIWSEILFHKLHKTVICSNAHGITRIINPETPVRIRPDPIKISSLEA